jgi:hypothetical protein
VLEELFVQCFGLPGTKQIDAGVKATDRPIAEVQRWFRLRKLIDSPSKFEKLGEMMWRGTFYLSASTYGYLMLRNKTWYHDLAYCWVCGHVYVCMFACRHARI